MRTCNINNGCPCKTGNYNCSTSNVGGSITIEKVPSESLERINGYNVQVEITSKDGTPMSELEFQVEFSIKSCDNKIIISKSDMVEITQEDSSKKYFAQFYDYELGVSNGWLIATVAIQYPDENWNCGFRDVTIENVFTGVYIGHVCNILPCTPCQGYCNCDDWVNGFKVNFEKVDYLSKETDIRYGVIRGLGSFGAITEEQLNGLSELTSKPSGVVNIPVTAGDTLVVLCDGATSMKGDGIGGKTTFDTSIMGANGESVTIGGKAYKAYGEIFLVSGTIEVYLFNR